MNNIFKFKPMVIDLEITNACPASCMMCPRDKFPKTGLMSDETFNSLIKNISRYPGNVMIGFCGIGEPLLHPKIFDYVSQLRTIPNIVKIGIVTAGEKLTPDVFNRLKSLGLDEIGISIQSLEPDLYQRLMKGLDLNKVLQNIDYISKNMGKMTILLNFTVHNLNRHETENIHNFAKAKNFILNINEIHSRGGNIESNELMNFFHETEITFSCSIFELITFVSWTGDIHPCCQDVGRKYQLTNIKDEDFESLYKKKMQLLFSDSGLPYDICKNCNDKNRYFNNQR